jgi:hypothetical protein
MTRLYPFGPRVITAIGRAAMDARTAAELAALNRMHLECDGPIPLRALTPRQLLDAVSEEI